MLKIAPLSTPATTSGAASPAIRKVAKEFEGMALAQMLQPMFEGLDTDGLGGGGEGEKMFRPMLVERYAQSLAERGGVGIADSVMRELMKLQGGQDGASR